MESPEQIQYRYSNTTAIAKSFVKRAKQDRDVVVAITGYEGEGKSNMAADIMIEILRDIGKSDDEIMDNFNNYMIYSPNKKEMEEKITTKEKYAPINSDEAIKALYKLNWNSRDQRFLNMLYALCRKENKINLLCIPRFTDLNEYFRTHRVMYWIHIVDRGLGVMMKKDDVNIFSSDPWHIYENDKMVKIATKRKKIIDYDADDKINILSKSFTFVTLVKSEKLEPKFQKIYLEGKEKFGYTDLNQADDVIGTESALAERRKEGLKNAALIFRSMGKSQPEISKILNISRETFYTYINEESQSTENELIINKTGISDDF
jgi:uncharacterized protein (DUF924 family)